mmetsp:Transcript_19610/g.53870  ORF Transcript_19610/g.53870 Transcript_19610/m.53870 type:complete len:103 (+) Transcript_19610:1722-2030(+)
MYRTRKRPSVRPAARTVTPNRAPSKARSLLRASARLPSTTGPLERGVAKAAAAEGVGAQGVDATALLRDGALAAPLPRRPATRVGRSQTSSANEGMSCFATK